MKCPRGYRIKSLVIVALMLTILKYISFTGKPFTVGVYEGVYLHSLELNSSFITTTKAKDVTRKSHVLEKNTRTVLVPEAINKENMLLQENISKPVKKYTDGYNLAKRLITRCNKTRPYPKFERVFGAYTSGAVQTCIIWKIGTTVLKRLYMMKELKEFKDLVNPYDIPFNKVYKPGPTIVNSDATTRFMFVRNPYSRLVSGYVDKLVAPNPIYWGIIGIPAIRATRKHSKSIRCGHDIKFHEFIQYVIKAMDPKYRAAKPDGHFERMTALCKPCGVKYDFVGKMETFMEDSFELQRRLNLSNETMKIMETEGAELAWMDAIKDTVHQPFDLKFRRDYLKCITFYDALRRSWEKLRMRGLIGRQEFPLKESETRGLKEATFLQLAVKARAKSTAIERKQLQKKYFLKMYSEVPKSDLESIREIYSKDFELFEYDDRPSILFGDK